MAVDPSRKAFVSPILSALSSVHSYSVAHRAALQQHIASFRSQREALLSRAKKAGLSVIPSNFPQALDDIFDTDDGGKLIDTFFKVQVDSVESVQKAVAFCKDEKVLALPIGAKTSAIGIFEARALAERFGLKGVIGLIFKKDPAPVSNGRITLVDRSVDGVQTKVVRAHASVTVSEVNDFLEQNLNDLQYRYRLMPDPTSKHDAQIGGIIATGAEGGNRSQASEDIFAVHVVDAEAAVQNIIGEDAKRFVGLNGNAGIICEAEFIPTAFPKFEHGVVIPVAKTGRDAWLQALQIQDTIRPFCFSCSKNPRIQEGKNDDKIIVTGIDILATSTLDLAIGESQDTFSRAVKGLYEESDLLLFVTFSSSIPSDDPAIFSSSLYKDILHLDFESAATDSSDNFIIKDNELFHLLRVLSEAELERMDNLRHASPAHARELARRMGGVSESTDINIRVNGETAHERAKALEKIAELYADYAESFKASDGFRCLPYGHLHPGVGKGGGIDVHIRAIFELSNPGSRYNAPEQVAELKSRQSSLFKKFLKLHGQFGIEICAPEKGKFASNEYWNWLCLTNSADARKDLELCARLGIALSDTGDQIPIIAGRIPHILPGIMKPSKNGVKGLLEQDADINTALLKLAMENPKGEKIRRLLSHVLLRIGEAFSLDKTLYPFFITSPQEATKIIERNFGANHAIQVISHDISKTFTCDSNAVHIVDLASILNRPLAILVVPESLIKQAYTSSGSESKAVFRNLYDMWSMWPFETLESPDIIAIARLGLWLDKDKKDQIYSNRSQARFSADVIGGIDLERIAAQNTLKTSTELASLQKFKEFIGIPDDYQIGITSSTTEAMQVIANALGKAKDSVRIIQVVNDVASSRWSNIMKRAGADVLAIVGSWTTGENSQLEDICSKVAAVLSDGSSKKSLLVLTPHKTSTTADVHPDHLVRELERLGYRLGRDYFMVCDLTSSLGARYYQTLLSPDTGAVRIPFQGFIAGGNRSLGLPAGIAFTALSSGILSLLGLKENFADQFLPKSSYAESLQWLDGLLDSYKKEKITVQNLEEDNRQKMNFILGWLEKHQDLIALVPNAYDRSPLLIGIFSQAKNMIVAKRLLQEIFGIRVGSGSGPFEREGFRIYIPHLSFDEVKELLASLDQILELDDVVHSRGENIPNIALREPHDPLSVIRRVARECTIDDLVKDQLGLDWLGRLIQTYNANIEDPHQLVQVGGKVPLLSTGHKMKAKIYGESNNIIEMKKILKLKNEETRLDLPFHFKLFKEAEEHLRAKVLGLPTATWADKDFTAAVEYLLKKAREHLSEIARLLEKYVEHEAARDSEGRVEWPIVA